MRTDSIRSRAGWWGGGGGEAEALNGSLGSIVLQRPSNRNPAGSRPNLLSVVNL